MITPVIRKAFMMSVHPDKHAEYELRHRSIWPKLEQAFKSHGVSNYSIFLNEETHQLFGYAEIESEELWQAIAETDICQEWWQFMKDIMPSNPNGSPVSQNLREVFHL